MATTVWMIVWTIIARQYKLAVILSISTQVSLTASLKYQEWISSKGNSSGEWHWLWNTQTGWTELPSCSHTLKPGSKKSCSLPTLWNISAYIISVWPAGSRHTHKHGHARTHAQSPAKPPEKKGTKTKECHYLEQKRWLKADSAGGIHFSPSWWCGLLMKSYDKIFHFHVVYRWTNGRLNVPSCYYFLWSQGGCDESF